MLPGLWYRSGRADDDRWEGCHVDRRDVEAMVGWRSRGSGTTTSAAVGVQASAVGWSPSRPIDSLRSRSPMGIHTGGRRSLLLRWKGYRVDRREMSRRGGTGWMVDLSLIVASWQSVDECSRVDRGRWCRQRSVSRRRRCDGRRLTRLELAVDSVPPRGRRRPGRRRRR